MTKEPNWDRRDEDAKVRGEVLKTLGSVQTAISLFDRSLSEAKARFELKAEKLADKLQEHEELLIGTEHEEGVFQWMHQADRNIKALIKGVLGEDGANFEKSLKGQLESAHRAIEAIQAAQLRQELAISDLKEKKASRVALRGQNLALVATICSLVGAVTVAAIDKWGGRLVGDVERLYEQVVNPPIVQIPKGTPTPVPEYLKKKKKSRPIPEVGIPVEPTD